MSHAWHFSISTRHDSSRRISQLLTYSDPCDSHLQVRLLQLALHRASLEPAPETPAGSKCGSPGPHRDPVESTYHTSALPAALAPDRSLNQIQGFGLNLQSPKRSGTNVPSGPPLPSFPPPPESFKIKRAKPAQGPRPQRHKTGLNQSQGFLGPGPGLVEHSAE